MVLSEREMLLKQQRGLSAIIENAKLNVRKDGRGATLFVILDGDELEALIEACGQVDDLEPDMDEQSLSDANSCRALAPDMREPQIDKNQT
ncbi:hypothetical protein SAMN04515647_3745 [Cohaesibacter sp. ES.047]|uniref:hypothetical protein n=1 Tax=Cohaesibacter sp. ES.047 TaxID=1798205 RepID=UPI000BB6D8CD|nr:hypothetical protein [Cohaesibacter sp. ES.047]SNY93451.1 hypothetical protein SAMN04515647_3745 [Cohaesibacter sp. ES.047]